MRLLATIEWARHKKAGRALEEFLQEACEELEALLPFRRGVSNDERSAKEVLDGFQRTLKDRAKQLRDEITPLLRKLESGSPVGTERGSTRESSRCFLGGSARLNCSNRRAMSSFYVSGLRYSVMAQGYTNLITVPLRKAAVPAPPV